MLFTSSNIWLHTCKLIHVTQIFLIFHITLRNSPVLKGISKNIFLFSQQKYMLLETLLMSNADALLMSKWRFEFALGHSKCAKLL